MVVVSKIHSSGTNNNVHTERVNNSHKMSIYSRNQRSILQIQTWSVTQVIQLLQQKNLTDCIQAIEKHEINGEEFLTLTEGRVALWKRDIQLDSRRKLIDLVNDLNVNPDRYALPAKPPLEPKPAAIALSKNSRIPITVFQEKKDIANFSNPKLPVQKLNIDISKLDHTKLAKALRENFPNKFSSESQGSNSKENKRNFNTSVSQTSTLNKRLPPRIPPEEENEEILYLNQSETESMPNNTTNESEQPIYLNHDEPPPLPPKIDQGSLKSKSLDSLSNTSWDSFDDALEKEDEQPLQPPPRPAMKNKPSLNQLEEPLPPTPLNFRPMIKPPPPPFSSKLSINDNEMNSHEEDIYELPDDEEEETYTSIVDQSNDISKSDDYYLEPIGGTEHQPPPLPAKPALLSVSEVRRRSQDSSTSGSSGDGTIGNRTMGYLKQVINRRSNTSLNSNDKTHMDWEKSPEPRKPSAVGPRGSNSSLSSSGGGGTLKTQRPLPAPPTTLSESPRKISNGAVTTTPGIPTWQMQPWYFSNADRDRAQELVSSKAEDGCFIFRPSRHTSNPLTLTLWYNGRVYNIPVRMRSTDNLYALGSEKDNEMTFSSIDEIVNYYKKEQLILYSGGVRTGRTYLRSWPRK